MVASLFAQLISVNLCWPTQRTHTLECDLWLPGICKQQVHLQAQALQLSPRIIISMRPNQSWSLVYSTTYMDCSPFLLPGVSSSCWYIPAIVLTRQPCQWVAQQSLWLHRQSHKVISWSGNKPQQHRLSHGIPRQWFVGSLKWIHSQWRPSHQQLLSHRCVSVLRPQASVNARASRNWRECL